MNRGSGSNVAEIRRPHLTHQASIAAEIGTDRRRRSRQISMALVDELELSNAAAAASISLAAQATTAAATAAWRTSIDQTPFFTNNNNFYFQGNELNASSPVDSLFSLSDLRRFSKVMPAAAATLVGSRAGTTLIVRRPTITLQEDGRYMIGYNSTSLARL